MRAIVPLALCLALVPTALAAIDYDHTLQDPPSDVRNAGGVVNDPSVDLRSVWSELLGDQFLVRFQTEAPLAADGVQLVASFPWDRNGDSTVTVMVLRDDGQTRATTGWYGSDGEPDSTVHEVDVVVDGQRTTVTIPKRHLPTISEQGCFALQSASVTRLPPGETSPSVDVAATEDHACASRATSATRSTSGTSSSSSGASGGAGWILWAIIGGVVLLLLLAVIVVVLLVRRRKS